MSKCTVVSNLPFGLSESKPGQMPYLYVIPPAPKGGISVLHVDDAAYFELIPLADEKIPPRRVPILSASVAQGIITDYVGSNLAVSFDPLPNGAVPIPGLFYVEGAYSPKEIEAKFPNQIAKAKRNTMAWFQRLVKIADDDWSKNHKHQSINELQKAACKFLGLEREWNFDIFDVASVTTCPACKTTVNPEAIICSVCKFILNDAKYKEMKNQFAVQ